MLYDIGGGGNIVLNIPNGPTNINLELWSQWINQKITSEVGGRWNELTQFYNDITDQWQAIDGTAGTAGIPFQLVTSNDRYSEYEPAIPGYNADLATREVTGIYNAIIRNAANDTLLLETIIKLTNSTSDIGPTRYISSNEDAEGFAYLQNN